MPTSPSPLATAIRHQVGEQTAISVDPVVTEVCALLLRFSRSTGRPLPPVTLTAYGQVVSSYSPGYRCTATCPPVSGTERTSVNGVLSGAEALQCTRLSAMTTSD